MKIIPKRNWLPVISTLAVLLVEPLSLRAREPDPVAQSAVHVLRGCLMIRPDGEHHRTLTALRNLKDPDLIPLFDELARSKSPIHQVHGLLGLAQCDPQRGLDLARVAAIADPATQAQVISGALDDELLTPDQAKQIVAWPGMDVAVKVIVAAGLIQGGQFSDLSLLREAAKSDNLARKSLANLLRLQLGDSQALQELEALNRSDDPQRDEVRLMLLETALRYELGRGASWAGTICRDPSTHQGVYLLALRLAMRHGHPEGVPTWQRQFASSTDPAQRTRLAMLALGQAPWLDPGFFATLARDQDPLIQQIGKTGSAIASRRQIAESVISLIELHHPLTNRWALKYAQEHAGPDDALAILLGLILSFEDYDTRSRTEAIQVVVAATRALCNRDAQTTAALLQPVLADPKTNPMLAQGIFLGLLGCPAEKSRPVVAGLTGFNHTGPNNLFILLLATQGQTLSPQQGDDLKLLVRGGGELPKTLRLKAAWAYLKRTEQTQPALAGALQG